MVHFCVCTVTIKKWNWRHRCRQVLIQNQIRFPKTQKRFGSIKCPIPCDKVTIQIFIYTYRTITSFNFIDEVKYFLRQLDSYTFGHDIESVSKDVIFLREVKKSAPIHPISSFDRETSRSLSRLDSFKPKLVIADVYKFPERETHLDLPDKKEFERYYEKKSQNLR